MTSYWIYESHPHDKAIIHKNDCAYCCNGTHRQGTRVKRDGSWLGPYDTHDKAATIAAGTRRKTQGCCKHCHDAPVKRITMGSR